MNLNIQQKKMYMICSTVLKPKLFLMSLVLSRIGRKWKNILIFAECLLLADAYAQRVDCPWEVDSALADIYHLTILIYLGRQNLKQCCPWFSLLWLFLCFSRQNHSFKNWTGPTGLTWNRSLTRSGFWINLIVIKMQLTSIELAGFWSDRRIQLKQ